MRQIFFLKANKLSITVHIKITKTKPTQQGLTKGRETTHNPLVLTS